VWGQRSPEQGHGHHVEAVGATLGRPGGQGGGVGDQSTGLSHKGWRGGGTTGPTGADPFAARERGKRGAGRERRRGGEAEEEFGVKILGGDEKRRGGRKVKLATRTILRRRGETESDGKGGSLNRWGLKK